LHGTDPGAQNFLKSFLFLFEVFVVIVPVSEVLIYVLFLNRHNTDVLTTKVTTALFIPRHLEKVANSKYYPCTSARNICPATGCVLQYKCHLGNI